MKESHSRVKPALQDHRWIEKRDEALSKLSSAETGVHKAYDVTYSRRTKWDVCEQLEFELLLGEIENQMWDFGPQ
eukprot:scaffold170238_cov33-Prasinocladus_malaysianus.AAC.1